MTADTAPPTTDPKDERLIAVEVDKGRAEIAKLEAETLALGLEQSIRAAQLRTHLASASMAELTAEERHQEALEIHADDSYHGVYTFSSDVTAQSVSLCQRTLTQWTRLHKERPIEIRFNSPGGSLVHGMALWDYINSIKPQVNVTTVAYGMAASMAGILLQAGHVRVMGRESYLLLHEASFSAGGSLGEVKDTVKWVDKATERILDIFAERATISRAKIKAGMKRTDWWIDSTEALKLGFVDEVR